MFPVHPQRNLSVDILKLILALFVVGIHSGFGKGISTEFRFLLFNGLFKIAVPAFLVINGYYFYEKIIAGKRDFGTWRNKLIKLYLVWLLIYLPFYWPHTTDLSNALFEFAAAIMFGPFHLWYIVATLEAGLLVNWLAHKVKASLLSGIAICAYLTGLYLQHALSSRSINDSTLLNIFTDASIYRNFFFLGMPFFTLGYMLARKRFANRIHSRAVLLTCTALSVTAVLAEALINYRLIRTDGFSFEFMFTLPFAAALLFLCAQNLYRPAKNEALAELSTAIYLVHPLLVLLLINRVSGSLEALTAVLIVVTMLISRLLLRFEFTRKLLF